MRFPESREPSAVSIRKCWLEFYFHVYTIPAAPFRLQWKQINFASFTRRATKNWQNANDKFNSSWNFIARMTHARTTQFVIYRRFFGFLPPKCGANQIPIRLYGLRCDRILLLLSIVLVQFLAILPMCLACSSVASVSYLFIFMRATCGLRRKAAAFSLSTHREAYVYRWQNYWHGYSDGAFTIVSTHFFFVFRFVSVTVCIWGRGGKDNSNDAFIVITVSFMHWIIRIRFNCK